MIYILTRDLLEPLFVTKNRYSFEPPMVHGAPLSHFLHSLELLYAFLELFAHQGIFFRLLAVLFGAHQSSFGLDWAFAQPREFRRLKTFKILKLPEGRALLKSSFSLAPLALS